ncbi:MAG: hypothetical protein NTZ48_00850, partial [Candidatus Omnitrophica bacterium]|nr:hypothetical protein [Candidatus Omnitrophota bacterium]
MDRRIVKMVVIIIAFATFYFGHSIAKALSSEDTKQCAWLMNSIAKFYLVNNKKPARIIDFVDENNANSKTIFQEMIKYLQSNEYIQSKDMDKQIGYIPTKKGIEWLDSL